MTTGVGRAGRGQNPSKENERRRPALPQIVAGVAPFLLLAIALAVGLVPVVHGTGFDGHSVAAITLVAVAFWIRGIR